MQTLINAWKLRLARRAFDRAATEHHRLTRAWCGPILDTTTPPAILRRKLDEAAVTMDRAQRTIFKMMAAH